MTITIAAVALLTILAQQPGAGPLPRVVIETGAGEITIEVDTVRAPVTGANFLKYVDAGLYDGGRFHRTVTTTPDNQPQNDVKIAVIQAGADPARRREYLPPIPLEPTSATTLTHADGVVSMARADPDSARDQFFICVGDQPELDAGGNVAHRGCVETLFDEEFLRRFLDAILILFDRAGTEFGHPLIKTNVRILFKSRFVSRPDVRGIGSVP